MKVPDGGLTALGVRRPILITVINLIILLAGLVSLLGMDIRELPDVDRPIITVRAEYPGASPATMDAEVTAKLEGAAARVSGIERIASSSEENNMRMRVEFSTEIDLTDAANDIREAVSRVTRDLPEGVEQLLVVKADSEARAIMTVVASSTELSKQDLTERIERDIMPGFFSVDGVADVQLDGAQPRVLRILFDPAQLASFQLSVPEVTARLESLNLDIPAGSYVSSDQELLVRANASVLDPELIRNIEIRPDIKVGDVAEVFFDAQTPESRSVLDGQSVVSMGIVRQAGANTLDIADEVHQRIQQMQIQYPRIQLTVTTDDSVFISGALSEVAMTLIFAVGVVLIVIALFLGEVRATLIPAVTMPVAIVGTLAAIWLAGFSLNLLTLLALVLATGLIVDDAIVVLENIQRRLRQGLPLMAASVLGTRQVFFAVIATTVTLVSVFLPIAFLPGETGRMFKEFGMVLSMAVIISTFVAVTLCPMMASRILKSGDHPPPRWMKRMNQLGATLAEFYFITLEEVIRHRWVCLVLALALAGLGLYGFKQLSQELLPQEDRGRLVVLLTGPDGASLAYSEKMAVQIEEILLPYQQKGQIANVFAIVGRWDKNRTWVAATLPDWDKRDFNQSELAKEINAAIKAIPGAQIRVIQENSLDVRGATAGLKIAVLGSDYDQLAQVADDLGQKIKDAVPEVEDARVQYDTSQPELSFEIDRRKAADLGIDVDQISDTLRIMVNEYRLLDLSIQDRAVPVMLGSARGRIDDPSDLLNLFLINNQGQRVPLQALVTVQERGVAAELDRHAQRRAVEIDLGVAPGVSLGDTLAQVETTARANLPPGVDLLLLGEAASLKETSNEMAITFLIALVVVFLVLAAQFESITSALIVIFTVPFGLAAAVFALLVTDQTLNLYSQIGLVMLIGLMTKNAILMIEMMDQLRDAGRSVDEAIREGMHLRLRPVMMTVLSTVLGGLPLILTSGPGAEARLAIGWVIVGGLGLSTLFSLYLAPLGYALLARFVKPRAGASQKLEEEFRNLRADQINEKEQML